MARAIHKAYVDLRREKGDTEATNPSMAPWRDLGEALKRSNREQALDIGKKLRAMSCSVSSLLDWDAPFFEFTSDEIETLARMEHERYLKERHDAAWRYGPKRDLVLKTNPNLVPWGDLLETTREPRTSALSPSLIMDSTGSPASRGPRHPPPRTPTCVDPTTSARRQPHARPADPSKSYGECAWGPWPTPWRPSRAPPRVTSYLKVIQIGIGPEEIGRNRRADVALPGDVKVVLRQLGWALEELGNPKADPAWAATLKECPVQSVDVITAISRTTSSPRAP